MAKETTQKVTENLTSFHIKNFKPYKKRQEIKFAPLTFLYGPNSAGKTSLIQSILLTAQSQNISGKSNLLLKSDLLLQGDYYEAGNIESLAHKKNFKDELVIGWTTKPNIEGYQNGISCHYKYNPRQQTITLSKVITNNISKIRKDRLGNEEDIDLDVELSWTMKTSANRRTLKKHIKELYNPKSIWWIDTETDEGIKNVELLKKYATLLFLSKQPVQKDLEKIDKLDEMIGMQSLIKVENQIDASVRYLNFEESVNGWEEEKEGDFFYANESNANSSVVKERNELVTEFIEIRKAIHALVENLFMIQEKSNAWPKSGSPLSVANAILGFRKGSNKLFQMSNSMSIINAFTELLSLTQRPGRLSLPFSEFGYIGPLRGNPLPFYYITSELDRNVGKKGEHWVNNIINYNNLKGTKERDINEQLNYWCNRLYGYNLTFEENSQGNRNLASVLLNKDKGNKSTQVTIDNVGFGISQSLPILAEGLIQKNALIIVEQPEIHIHPRLQAEFVEFLSETSIMKDQQEGNNWLIETHSHLMALRVQKKIREGEMKKDDVAFYYCEPTDEGTEFRELRLDDEGNWLDIWPSGFFEEAYNEKFQ